ncbi:MAG: sugar ABC transporter permease [Firmicutes bacterium]|nr:sugar ABC transporter permease [Candidatus Colimorpha enterica]
MTKSSAKQAPRKIVSLDKRKARAGWLFVLPFVIGFIIIYLPIILDSLKYSFSKINIVAGGGYETVSVGFANYQSALFEDPSYVQILLSGLTQLVTDVPAIVIFALFMAVLLNGKILGRAAFRAIFFIPVIISTGVVANIDSMNILQSHMDSGSAIDDGPGDTGATNIINLADVTWLFSNMQVGTELRQYVVALVNNIFNVIKRSGVQMLIFLAGLQSISPAIYESCSIDGATAWETFWKITFPMVSPMILVNAIYTLIDSFTSESNSVMKYIENVYSQAGQNCVSTAMSWIYFIIIVLAVALVAALLSAYVFYQKRD